ncbi:MAG: hypothetical protein ABSB22_11110 [Thermodesulfobacteriota bacterium]|jgi:hypothetical protein
MAESKYGKYVVEAPVTTGQFGPLAEFIGEKHYGTEFSLLFAHITEPILMEDAPHAHDFNMYLYFFGRDNMAELDAEIEIGFGAEQETHTVTTPTSIYIPKGLIHCPLEFKRVGKPILFVHATIAAKYAKLPKP